MHRHFNSSWENVGHAGERDISSWRCPEELEVKYPDSDCEQSAHYYTEVFREIFLCKYCWKSLWLPSTLFCAIELANDMKYFGHQVAYNYYTSHRGGVTDILQTLEALRQLRGKVSDEDYAKTVVEVFSYLNIPHRRYTTPRSLKPVVGLNRRKHKRNKGKYLAH